MSWTVVYTSSQPHIIEIVKSILADHQIQCVVIDKRDSMYTSITEGSIEVHIQGQDFLKTKKILKELESE